MADSLTAIYFEPHQCPSHQSILLIQGPIHEIFTKKYWELSELKNDLFLSRPFWIFFFKTKKKKFCFIPMKISQSYFTSKNGSKCWWLLWFPAKNHSTQTFQPPVDLAYRIYSYSFCGNYVVVRQSEVWSCGYVCWWRCSWIFTWNCKHRF